MGTYSGEELRILAAGAHVGLSVSCPRLRDSSMHAPSCSTLEQQLSPLLSVRTAPRWQCLAIWGLEWVERLSIGGIWVVHVAAKTEGSVRRHCRFFRGVDGEWETLENGGSVDRQDRLSAPATATTRKSTTTTLRVLTSDYPWYSNRPQYVVSTTASPAMGRRPQLHAAVEA
jgi:hypothetical protein